MAHSERRLRMVAEQLRPRGITDERVLAAMAEVPREEFLPPALRSLAYDDRALAIEAGQTISQPLIVAAIAQALELRPDDAVLDVGLGSGYQAAVLSRLCAHVSGIELEPVLAERAAATLTRLGYSNVEVAIGDGREGRPAAAPFEGIAVAAASTDLPPALPEQLAPGGRLVIPLGPAGADQQLVLFRRTAATFERTDLFPVRFVPLRFVPLR